MWDKEFRQLGCSSKVGNGGDEPFLGGFAVSISHKPCYRVLKYGLLEELSAETKKNALLFFKTSFLKEAVVKEKMSHQSE